MRSSIFFHLLLYPIPIPSQFHMFYFETHQVCSVLPIQVWWPHPETPPILFPQATTSCQQLFSQKWDLVTPSSTNKPLSGLILYGPCACSVASMSSCVPLACHSMKTLSQHSQPLLLVLRIFSPPLLSLGRKECDRCPTIVSLHLDLLWVSL